MRTISLDIETYSSVDLAKSGVYRYCESPDFEVLFFACSIDGGTVEVFDLANGEELPSFIVHALLNENIEKRAWCASFERICLSRHILKDCNSYLSPVGWRCTMIQAAYLGLPFSLEQAGQVLGIEKAKLADGRRLINKFSKPQKHTDQITLGMQDQDWELFKAYNRRDVEAEMEIHSKLSA